MNLAIDIQFCSGYGLEIIENLYDQNDFIWSLSIPLSAKTSTNYRSACPAMWVNADDFGIVKAAV